MRPIRRAKLAMLGSTRFAQSLMGGFKGKEKALKPAKVSTSLAFQHGKALMDSGQTSMEDHTSVGSKGSGAKVTFIVSGSLPVTAKAPVTQQDFIDALTAVMTGKVEFSNDGEFYDDDEHSISTVSTKSMGSG